MPIELRNLIGSPLLAGVVELSGVHVQQASFALQEECRSRVATVVAAGFHAAGSSAYLPETQRVAIRHLLKGDGFSPTGRNRPAQELLLNMVLAEQSFPHISGPVDVNNLLSLELLFPISLLNADKLGPVAELRWGGAGESFVFNQSGHSLSVEHCLVVADSTGQAVASPVKDGMVAKVFDDCTALLAILYASAELVDAIGLAQSLERFASLLTRETGGRVLQLKVV